MSVPFYLLRSFASFKLTRRGLCCAKRTVPFVRLCSRGSFSVLPTELPDKNFFPQCFRHPVTIRPCWLRTPSIGASDGDLCSPAPYIVPYRIVLLARKLRRSRDTKLFYSLGGPVSIDFSTVHANSSLRFQFYPVIMYPQKQVRCEVL